MDRFKTLNEWYQYEQINESVLDSIWTYIKNAINFSKYKTVTKMLMKKLYKIELAHKIEIYDMELDGNEKINDMAEKKLEAWKEQKRPTIVDKVGVEKADEMQKKFLADLKEAGKDKLEKDIEIKKSAFSKAKAEIDDKLNLSNEEWSMSEKQKGKASIYKQTIEAENMYNIQIQLAEYKGTKVSAEDEKAYQKKLNDLKEKEKEVDKKEEPIGEPVNIPEEPEEGDEPDKLKEVKAASVEMLSQRNAMVNNLSELIQSEVKFEISKASREAVKNSGKEAGEEGKEGGDSTEADKEIESLKNEIEAAKAKFDESKEDFSKAKEAFNSSLSGEGLSDNTRDKFDAVKASMPSTDELMSKKEEVVKQATSDL